MYNKSNILDIIAEHQRDINEINVEMEKPLSGVVKQALREKLNFLEDNLYRYKLQARAWGLKV